MPSVSRDTEGILGALRSSHQHLKLPASRSAGLFRFCSAILQRVPEMNQAAFLEPALAVAVTAFTVALVAAATLASAISATCLAALLTLS